MVDYLLVKRNNHIFVVVYRGTDLAAIAVDVRNISFLVHMWQKMYMVSVKFIFSHSL